MNDIADFVINADFDEKLKKINKNVTSNKTKHLDFEKKLNDLSAEIKLASTKVLTKHLINK